jgi:hypothetical protein
MSGVYNRKLFRKSSARDELRRMGGIMASSEELLQEAMRTADQAPRPSGPGPMPMPQQAPMMAPPAMAPAMAMPMMGQPMMPQPMGQPMMAPPMQAPMMGQPMMQQPAFMPPMMPPSVQAQPIGYQAGGTVSADEARKRALLAAAGAGGFVPDLGLPGINVSTPAPRKIDVGATAGTVVEQPTVDADTVIKAEELVTRIDEEPPEAVAQEILDTAAQKGAELSGDMQSDLAQIYANLTGDPAAYEKNIDALNRGILGAAIAAGKSARATENIAQGMLVGLEAARDTEERRVRDARALQLAQLQARAAQAKGGAGGAESRDYRNPVDAYQDAYQAVMNAGEFDITIPEGMSREDYADQVATDLIRRSYTADQLVGSPFEGLSVPEANPVAGGGAGATQTEADLLSSARAAIQAGAPEEAVKERLKGLGIDPEKL